MPTPFAITKRPPRRAPWAWAVALVATALAVPLGLSALGGGLWVAHRSAEVPDLRLEPPTRVRAATVLYASGGQELARYYRENRLPVGYNAIARPVVDALVATEDHRFYDHAGVDWRRIAASAWHTLRGDRQGGSTITMQLARNRYPAIAGAPDLKRKALEVLTARAIAKRYTKPEVVEMYLNTVPFGRRAFGIHSAARLYFGKAPRALSVPEAATLVGMLKATSRYDPLRHPERARQRRNVVLAQMARRGFLTAAEAARFQAAPLALRMRPPALEAGPAPHFAEHVRRWLDAWAAREGRNLYTEGLRVYTTLDVQMQQMASAAAAKQLGALQTVAAYEWSRPRARLLSENIAAYAGRDTSFAYLWRADPHLADAALRRTPRYRQLRQRGLSSRSVLARLRADAAFADSAKAALTRLEVGFVALDPRSGFVKAWVGGRDFEQGAYDHVALARRQPGSTFKPFVYGAALDFGYGPEDALAGGRIRAAPQPGPDAVTLRDGLAFSRNDVAAKITEEIGPHEIAAFARRMGIRSRLRPVPSLALGTSEVTLLEMASAYATLAAGGTRRPPQTVLRIEDRRGAVLYEAPARGRKALSVYTAYTLVDMMRGVVRYGTGSALSRAWGLADLDLAGKTGTTQHNADGWFLAMHPDLVAGAWVGFNDPRVHFRTDHWGYGSSNALRVVGAFLRQARAEDVLRPGARFEAPPGYRTARAPSPQRHADPDSAFAAGQQPHDAFALGLDSTRRTAEEEALDPLTRQAADPERALRQALRSSEKQDDSR